MVESMNWSPRGVAGGEDGVEVGGARKKIQWRMGSCQNPCTPASIPDTDTRFARKSDVRQETDSAVSSRLRTQLVRLYPWLG